MKSSFLLCLVLLFAACSDDHDNTCLTTDPAQDLPWLKTLIEKSRTDDIDVIVEQGKYHFQTVFIIHEGCLLTMRFAPINYPVYTCKGKTLKDVYSLDPDIQDLKVIWKTPDDETECW